MTQATHTAIVTTAPGARLSALEVPTPRPEGNEVRLISQWTGSTPFDLHQNDGHLAVTPPTILGSTMAGVVVEVGPEAKRLKVGDRVFGFGWRMSKEKAHQEYVVIPENLLGVIPDGFTMQQAVTIPDNFVTILNVCVTDFGWDLPWPKPDNYKPKDADETILIWGGSSSSGMYALQFLKWLGYTELIAVASAKHHAKLSEYGAKMCFDYRGGTDETVRKINEFQAQRGRPIKYFYDCITNQDGSLRPISRIAQSGALVAALLPVVVRDAAEGVLPEYSFDVQSSATWAAGVTTRGVRTHAYLDNAFLAEKGQPEIMPIALASGVIEPNAQVIVEGDTMLERAERAMTMLRNKTVSGQRLVWRVSDRPHA